MLPVSLWPDDEGLALVLCVLGQGLVLELGVSAAWYTQSLGWHPSVI